MEITTEEIIEILKGEDTEKQTILLRELSIQDPIPEIYELTIDNLKSRDSRVRFFCLDMLIKKFTKQTASDAERLIPIFIAMLLDENHPVVDRAILALKVIGEKSVIALLETLQVTNNDRLKTICIWALVQSNFITYKHLLIKLLLENLENGSENVKRVTIDSLMYISPLYPQFGFENAIYHNFELIYKRVYEVAKSILSNSNKEDHEFLMRHIALIEEHWQKREI